MVRLQSGTEGSARFEKRYLHKNGSVVWADLSAVLLRGVTGRPNHFVADVQDITARKRAEAELAEYRDRLEELVSARTRELELSNKELEAFSYSVSHDLRAPLRAINGFARALEEDYAAQLDAVANDYLDRMRAASCRMAELIDDLLDLARIARLPLERKPVNLSELARTITGELREAEPARQVELVIQDGMTAQADPVLAAILLRNLLENAWKFTGKHPTARIEVGETVRDGEPVWFVRDDGAGFDMAHVGSLFAPFQRLHAAGDFAGTGIGLATVQRIVRRHGGRGWIEGAVEKGATYYFTFAKTTKEA
jgi:light-regulated signal transduction histidine kinase (bacteriophytochrome)